MFSTMLNIFQELPRFLRYFRDLQQIKKYYNILISHKNKNYCQYSFWHPQGKGFPWQSFLVLPWYFIHGTERKQYKAHRGSFPGRNTATLALLDSTWRQSHWNRTNWSKCSGRFSDPWGPTGVQTLRGKRWAENDRPRCSVWKARVSYLRLLSGSGSLRRWNRSFGQHLVHFAYD